MYASKDDVELGVSFGFEHDRSVEEGSSFTKPHNFGYRRIWSTENGWQTCDVVKGRVINHCKFRMLSNAFNRKLPERDSDMIRRTVYETMLANRKLADDES